MRWLMYVACCPTPTRSRSFARRCTDFIRSRTIYSDAIVPIVTSVAIELDQARVTDPEVMRDLVEHDVSDLAV
jgi:hypothetical protein